MATEKQKRAARVLGRLKSGFKPHRFRMRLPKKLPWLVTCVYCGMIPLRNDASQREALKACTARMELKPEEEQLDD